MRAALIEQIRAYIPVNEQEERDKEIILQMLEREQDIFYRSNRIAHMTASAWVLDTARQHILMAYHKLYDSWSWLGGHADGEEDLLQVAMKEVKEESGLPIVRPITKDILSLEVVTVNGHEKKGAYVSSHLHLNVTYLLEADERMPLRVKEDENSALGWFLPKEGVAKSTEPWYQERIYKKLNDRLRTLSR